MSELPPDPFNRDPRFGLSGDPNGHLTELAENGGVVTDMAAQATAVLGEHQRYTDPEVGLQLGTFNGETVLVDRKDLSRAGLQPYAPPAITESKVAGTGLGAWFQRRRRSRVSPPNNSVHYTITIGQPENDTIVLEAISPFGNSITVEGHRIIETDDEPVTVGLNSEELAAAATQATDIMRVGFPLSVETAIAERQNRRCSIITGREAVDVARSIEAVVVPQDGSDIGSVTAAQGIHNYGVIVPRLDGQWSIGGVTVIHRAGTVIPNVQGPKGRSVITSLDFSPGGQDVAGQWAPGAFLVTVESVYDHSTGRLINAEVRYFTRVPHIPNQPAPVGPTERAGLHEAIANQVDMGNLIPRHQLGFE